ncbi:MAG: DUF692 domain-containing protein [Georgfuchsia sp.]
MYRQHTPAATLPASAGIGLRAPHHREVLETPPDIGWLEVHSENFFGAGGQPLRVLEMVRDRYPISLHGVGLSLGAVDELSRCHLDKLKALVSRIEPAAISEHLCWSSVNGRFLNDLLPLPYTQEALDNVCERVARTQDFLGRTILVENVSSYLRFAGAEIPEWDFVAAVARRTGCGILLDVNNTYVNACNHGFDAQAYLAAIPVGSVGEIHLAGYEEEEDGLLIDTHSRPVYEPVWALYADALARFGPIATLIEWDNDIPALDTLLAEAGKAERLLTTTREACHARAA